MAAQPDHGGGVFARASRWPADNRCEARVFRTVSAAVRHSSRARLCSRRARWIVAATSGLAGRGARALGRRCSANQAIRRAVRPRCAFCRHADEQ